jgi:hypothetical protein
MSRNSAFPAQAQRRARRAVGKGPVQSLRRYAGDGKGGFTVEVLCDVRFVPILDGVARE